MLPKSRPVGPGRTVPDTEGTSLVDALTSPHHRDAKGLLKSTFRALGQIVLTG